MRVLVYLVLPILAAQLAAASAMAAAIPAEVLSGIEARAAAAFPDDHAKQRQQIRAQTRAYRQIENYRNKDLSDELFAQIKAMAEQEFPFDHAARLSRIKQLEHSYIKLGYLSTRSFTGGMVKCKKLRWRVANRAAREMLYRGSLESGSADAIYLVVTSNLGLIGQNFGFPGPDGTWEISIWGDYAKGTTREENFYCERY